MFQKVSAEVLCVDIHQFVLNRRKTTFQSLLTGAIDATSQDDHERQILTKHSLYFEYLQCKLKLIMQCENFMVSGIFEKTPSCGLMVRYYDQSTLCLLMTAHT